MELEIPQSRVADPYFHFHHFRSLILAITMITLLKITLQIYCITFKGLRWI